VLWFRLAAVPLAITLTVQVAKSEDPLFWSAAAILSVIAITLFVRLVLAPMERLGRNTTGLRHPLNKGSAWGSLLLLTAGCGAAVVYDWDSPMQAVFLLAFCLAETWSPRGGRS
jgi:hypothetical protein